MSRSGYSDDWGGNEWQYIRWRGAVTSALRGKRGQAFLRELLAALDALPEPRLVASAMERDGDYCALGSVARARGEMLVLPDPDYEWGYDREGRRTIAEHFGIASAMAAEIMYENDEGTWNPETPEHRFLRMRAWVFEHLEEA